MELKKIVGEHHKGYSSQIAFRPDGSVLAIAGLSSIRLIDVPRVSVIGILDKPIAYFDWARGISDVAFSASGKSLVWVDPPSLSWKKIAEKGPPKTISNQSTPDYRCRFDQDEKYLIGINFRTYNFAPAVSAKVKPPRSLIYSSSLSKFGFAFSKDGSLCANSGPDLIFSRVDQLTGARKFPFNEKLSDVKQALPVETVRIWDTATGKEIKRLVGHTHEVRAIAFSGDGKSIASVSQDGDVRVWDWANEKTNFKIPLPSEATAIFAFAPNAKILAFACGENLVLVDVVTGKENARLLGHSGHLTSVLFSPDGTLVATGSSDGLVQVRNVQNHKSVALFRAHYDPINALAFSPDGLNLVSGGVRSNIYLWEINPAKKE